MNIGSGPLGTMVMPSGVKMKQTTVMGLLGTMVMPFVMMVMSWVSNNRNELWLWTLWARWLCLRALKGNEHQ